MARPTFESQFLNALIELGGRASNPALRAALEWDEDKYWTNHTKLYEKGKIEKGKGKGGTAILIEEIENSDENIDNAEVKVDQVVEEVVHIATEEKYLYDPIQKELSNHWNRQQNLDTCHVENVARQGSKDTGGSWTRPDIALVGMRTYEYLPNKNLEIHTFEVKPSYDVSVKGVMEALSHKEFATKAYVIFCTDGKNFSDYPEAKRIEVIAGRYGIGVFAAINCDNFDTWEEIVSAVRSSPDPEEMDLFIKRTLTPETKTKLLKWLK